MKKIFAVLMAGGMIFSSVSAMAADVNIAINGEEFIPKNALGEVVEPFIENGSTYLPVRALGEVSGKEVAFDAENYAVYIGAKPMAEDVSAYPYVMIDGIVYTEGFLNLNYTAETFLQTYKMSKLVESKMQQGIVTEEDFENAKNAAIEYLGVTGEGKAAYMELFGITQNELDMFIEHMACEKVLSDLIVFEDADYDNFVTVKHILAEDEEKANEVIKKLGEGAIFDELIEEYNIDPGQTKDSSYTFTYGDMIEEFEKASFELEVGEYTAEPVASVYGYHIIIRLDLDKDSVEKSKYETNKMLKEIEKVPDPEKVVYLLNDGDVYGVIDGIEITNKEMEAMGVFLPQNYRLGFEEIKQGFAIKRACENGFLDENEIAIASRVNVHLLPDVSEEFATNILTALNMVAIAEEKFMESESAYAEFLFLMEEAEKELDAYIVRDIRVYVDGKIIIPSDVNGMYVKPMNVDGSVYVPVRAICEALGMSAAWDNDTRTVIIEK